MSYHSTPSFWATLRKALRLDEHLYDQALNTRSNRRIALTIVVLASLSHVLGSAVILLFNRTPLPILVIALVLDGFSVFAGYFLWTFIVLKLGQWLKPIDPTYQELLSPIGFAYAPQVLNLLTLIPLLGRVISLVLSLWSLMAVTIATREGLGIKTFQAAIICLLGWIPIQFASSAIIVLFSRSVSPSG